MVGFRFLGVVLLLGSISSGYADPDPRYVCTACVIVLGLTEQIKLQVNLASELKAKCEQVSDSALILDLCNSGVDEIIYALEADQRPEDICKSAGLCEDNCDDYNSGKNPKPVELYDEWPVTLPVQPKEWPVERRRRLTTQVVATLSDAFVALVSETGDKSTVQGVLSGVPEIGQALLATGRIMGQLNGLPDPLLAIKENEGCGGNVTCHIMAVAQHKPLKDGDGDSFATVENESLRGSHWRGVDCDDEHDDVYPGRKTSTYGSDVDHNCNGISGGNDKGSYEDQFCAGTEQRGLVMLGDSATAHFHVPPQWLTAQGWNLNGFKGDVLDELDFPQCSWGTGHVDVTDCPYQDVVPGDDPHPGIQSLYTLLRERNRCNHNDFQNIGVNGARMTSSLPLVQSMARGSEDHPVLVWLTLLGNDVCNGHPGFEHMTTPDAFYQYAMESYTAIDKVVPPGSYVVATNLFDGELLYQTMHAEQHPVGTTYEKFYDFMNCLQINPCWGWLNSDAAVRAETTRIAQSLNEVYSRIEQEQNFSNFKLIHFAPQWQSMFDEYAAAGFATTNLVEKSDGFHPSQAANNIFAQTFFQFLVDHHPEAVGPINPHNAEIDALFFSS